MRGGGWLCVSTSSVGVGGGGVVAGVFVFVFTLATFLRGKSSGRAKW